MGAITRILESIFGSLGNMINNMPQRAKKEIKSGFFGLIFVGCIAGAIMGFINGKEAAKIPGEPLAASIKDLFEYERSKEMRDGDFGNFLENNLIAESQYNDLDKTQFRTRESMSQAYDNIPIDPQTSPALSLADMNIPQDLIDGNYKTEGSVGSVNTIKRRTPESLLPEEIKADKLAPLETDENFKSDNSVKKLSTPSNEVKSEIPSQIDLNPDKLAPAEKNENLVPDKSINNISTPREKSQPEIPSQIDYSKEIIR